MGDKNNNNDAELVARVQKGDKQAFDLLVVKYQYRVIHLVSRYVRGDEAQDIAQDAFIKAYRGLANFRGESAFYTWLYRIAVNTAKNYLSSARHKREVGSVDASEAENYDDASLLRDGATPEQVLAAEQLEQKVFAAIKQLPPDLKRAITLREIEGLSYEQIATEMDCPIGTVRSRIFRAREAIDEVIKPYVEQP